MTNPKWAVKTVETHKDYTMLISFEDGKKGIYNAKPLLEEKFYAPLKNIHSFMQAKAECGTVIWENDIDIAPEHLYECSQEI